MEKEYQKLVKDVIRAQKERERQSQEWSQDPSPRDAPPPLSEAEHAQHGDRAMDSEFDANALMRSFWRATMGIAQRMLKRDAVVATVANEYVQTVHQFQADLHEQGLADHPIIIAMGIMRRSPTVQQVMAVTLFVQALERKNTGAEHLCIPRLFLEELHCLKTCQQVRMRGDI